MAVFLQRQLLNHLSKFCVAWHQVLLILLFDRQVRAATKLPHQMLSEALLNPRPQLILAYELKQMRL